MKLSLLIVTVFVTLAGLASRADAYPQFQLSHEQTCTGCHISPAGGALLNENGLAVADSMAQFSTAPEFFYDAFKTPAWLTLGGDLRSASGFIATPEKVLAYFPMQIEAYANFGPRPSQFGNEAATYVWSREHYVMWQQEAGSSEGLFILGGRFKPVFGLRLAEHPVYTRRYGGTPLFSARSHQSFNWLTICSVESVERSHTRVSSWRIDQVVCNAGLVSSTRWKLSRCSAGRRSASRCSHLRIAFTVE